MIDAALNMWRDKLEFLQIELAKAADPAAKFKLQKDIEEAETEIAILSGAKTPKTSRKIAGSQLEKHAPKKLFGRETELAALDAAWGKGTLNVYTLVAWGGAGKTSLVFHWVQTRFAAKGWPGVERYFDWSFYSQGTGESRQTSADLFIHKALEFFGDPDPTRGGPHERGERLARLIRQHRSLLILDGIEPLQYPPNDPQAGRLKDPALETLLRELAADNPGLVVITTREHLTNVEGHATTEEQKLDKLAREAAVALLRHLQIVGTDEELHAAWKDAGGHALTLSLLGRFIADAYEDRDIRHYREVKFEAADQEHQGRSAFKVMIAYERWMVGKRPWYRRLIEQAKRLLRGQLAGRNPPRELAILRLTGLFDRPMAKSCLQALRAEPSIPGLTDALVKLTPQQWNIAVKRLSEVELLSVSPDAIDAHPLIREYFALQLRATDATAFKAAHHRLYTHLSRTTQDKPNPNLIDLDPLYQAVTHGCLAGIPDKAFEEIYWKRVCQKDAKYSVRQLNAFGSELSALRNFFEDNWNVPSQLLSDEQKFLVLNQAAYSLRVLGYTETALRLVTESLVNSEDLRSRKFQHRLPSGFIGKSEILLELGQCKAAIEAGRQSVALADQFGDAFDKFFCRASYGESLFHTADDSANSIFLEAKECRDACQFANTGDFRCWQFWLREADLHAKLNTTPESSARKLLEEIQKKVVEQLRLQHNQFRSRLAYALAKLTECQCSLYAKVFDELVAENDSSCMGTKLEETITELRNTGARHHLSRGLLLRAWWMRLFEGATGKLTAKHDLDEAWEIASRSSMRLVMVDIHLYRARLFGSPAYSTQEIRGESECNFATRLEEQRIEMDCSGSKTTTDDLEPYPWESPAADITMAEKLINECEYRLRSEELAHAKNSLGLV